MSFQPNGTCTSKIKDRLGRSGDSSSNLVDAALVPSAFTDDLPTELSPSEQNRSIGSTDRTEPKTPPSKNETRSFPCLRKAFEKRGLSEETKKILMSSWRESTKKQYRSYQKKWMSFCYERNLDIFEANVLY